MHLSAFNSVINGTNSRNLNELCHRLGDIGLMTPTGKYLTLSLTEEYDGCGGTCGVDKVI